MSSDTTKPAVETRPAFGSGFIRCKSIEQMQKEYEGGEAVRFANPSLPDTRSEIALPLVVGNRVLGALDVQSTQPAAFDESSAVLLQTMADQIAISLSNTFQFKRVQVALQSMRQMVEASRDVLEAPDMPTMLEVVVTHAVPRATWANLILFGPQTPGEWSYLEYGADWVRPRSESNRLPVASGTRVTAGQLPFVRIIYSDQPTIISDVKNDQIDDDVRAGIVIASLFAAFMSTIESNVNLSGSFLLNDFYRPFIKKNGSEKHYVAASRVLVLVVSLLGAGFSYVLGSVRMGWQLVMELSAGIGLVLLLRWYWWRVNAWSEIAPLSASAATTVYLRIVPDNAIVRTLGAGLERAGFRVDAWGVSFLLIVAVTTVAWLTVTFLTGPDDTEKLLAFYRKVRPGGFWGPIARLNGRAYRLHAALSSGGRSRST